MTCIRPFGLRGRVLGILAGAALLGFAPATHAAPGDLDASFGGSGIVHETFGSSASLGAVAIQNDGKIVAAGTAGSPTSIGLARYESNGTLDSSFGSGGLVSATVDGAASALVVQSDGKLVTLGGNAAGDFLLARFASDGALDTSFGVGGTVTTDCGGNDYGAALVLQADGRLVAAGWRGNGGSAGTLCLARYTSDGSLDASFGGDGIVTAFDGTAIGLGLALQADGKLLVAANTGSNFVVARFNGDGSADTGFGTGGLAQATFGPVSTGFALAVAVQPNGRIVAAGATGGGDLGLARFLANGTTDASFGDGGTVSTDLGYTETADAVTLQPDGEIVVAGSSSYTSPPLGAHFEFVVARYDVNGALDTAFGTDGVASDSGGTAFALALQPDGKVVVGGTAVTTFLPPQQSEFVVARYSSLIVPCPPAAMAGCKAPTATRAAQLKIKATGSAAKNQLLWKWKKGAATSTGDFGDPLTTDDYAICLYDESNASALVAGAVVPAGRTCGTKPCWKATGATGYAYNDHDRTRFGIGTIKLHAGGSGSAKIVLKGQGAALPLPTLPLPLPLRGQLVNTSGQCWDATFSEAGLGKNDTERFQGKSD